MTNDQPIACSLGAGDLQRRLAEIAAVGADGLIDHAIEDGRHVLRFHAGGTTRDRLKAIVEAEASCCSFLDLGVAEEGDELILTIAAPQAGQAIADDLALAFARPRA